MSQPVSQITELHNSLFGYVPSKPGMAYERIGAIALATLGWGNVIHDTRERPPGRQASHQLDIVAHDPSGGIRRLLVECKEWDKEVGQATLNALIGVRAQTGADAAAVVTTQGFTRGALKVASDEDVALVRLAAYDPERHGTNFVKRVTLTIDRLTPIHSDFDVELVEPSGTQLRVQLTGADHLQLADGRAAERLMDVLRANAAPLQEGVFRQRAVLPPGRLIPTVGGALVEIRALSWIETNRRDTFDVVHEAKGDPVLVVQQLDDSGEVGLGRLVVSEDLFGWDIDQHGHVTPRGPLTIEDQRLSKRITD